MRLTASHRRSEKDPVPDDPREPDAPTADASSADASSAEAPGTDAPDTDARSVQVEPSEPSPSRDADAAAGTPAPRGRRLLWAGLALAVIIGLTGGLAWWGAAHDDEADLSRDRDAALVAAKQDIAILNTLDYRSVDDGIESWMDVTTGTLHDQFAAVSEEDQKLLADQKKVSTGKVVGAAVLDVDARTARVIASVEVTVADGDDLSAEPVVKRNRFSADLEKVDGTWLLSSLEQVAVDLS